MSPLNVIAYTQVQLNGDPWLFLFYSNCNVVKYNLRTQISVHCMNTTMAAESGPFSRGTQASASLVGMLASFGIGR